jgi:hypothetical protein
MAEHARSHAGTLGWRLPLAQLASRNTTEGFLICLLMTGVLIALRVPKMFWKPTGTIWNVSAAPVRSQSWIW